MKGRRFPFDAGLLNVYFVSAWASTPQLLIYLLGSETLGKERGKVACVLSMGYLFKDVAKIAVRLEST